MDMFRLSFIKYSQQTNEDKTPQEKQHQKVATTYMRVSLLGAE